MTKSSREKRITFDTVREIAGELSGAQEGTSYGAPAFKVRGVLFLRLWEDNETLVVRCEQDRRQAMIEEDPETYFLTDHYLNYPWILVHLSTIKREALREIINAAWQLATRTKSRR
jgi:hypothetical protein